MPLLISGIASLFFGLLSLNLQKANVDDESIINAWVPRMVFFCCGQYGDCSSVSIRVRFYRAAARQKRPLAGRGGVHGDSGYWVKSPGAARRVRLASAVQRGGNFRHTPFGGFVPFRDVLIWA